jgi:hypothetical protein
MMIGARRPVEVEPESGLGRWQRVTLPTSENLFGTRSHQADLIPPHVVFSLLTTGSRGSTFPSQVSV